MRTAVCIHGLARGSSEPSHGAWGERFSTLLEKIKDCDVFIHSWDEDISKELKDIFLPISSRFEGQIFFQDELKQFSKYGIYSRNVYIKQGEIFK